MKKIILVLLTSVIGLTFLKAEEREIIVKDKLKNVTVFMQNAQLFQEAYVSIPKGTSHFIFNGPRHGRRRRRRLGGGPRLRASCG